MLLSSRGEQDVGTMADALTIHPSTATRLCDRLLSKGFIDRATPTLQDQPMLFEDDSRSVGGSFLGGGRGLRDLGARSGQLHELC